MAKTRSLFQNASLAPNLQSRFSAFRELCCNRFYRSML